jgi:1,4-dihydroxy-2-naphthoate polyprenyltransferase
MIDGPDHHFTFTQPINPLGAESLASLQTREAQRWLRLRIALNRRPYTLLGTIASLARLRAALVFTLPVICGATLAWWESGTLNGWALIFNLLAVLALTLGMNTLNELRAYKNARLAHAVDDHEPVATGYGLLAQGYIEPEIALNLGYLLVTMGILCNLWLTMLVGWPALFFTGLSFLLAYTYAHPPIKYGYWGWGLGEIGLLAAYGALPLINSYYVQGQALTWLAGAVSIPISLLCAIIGFNYNLLFERRDWRMRKRTIAVQIGPLRALDVSALLVIAVHVTIVGIVSLARLPFSTLLTLATLPMALGVYAQLQRDRFSQEESFLLYRVSVNAALWTGLLLSLALITDKLF